MGYEKPVPFKNEDNRPYWDAADRHELSVQRCNICEEYAHPPGPSCAHCGSTEMSWINLGNDVKAKIYSYVISYRPFLPGFQDDLPLIIAQAELEQAPEVKIMCNVLECKPEDIEIGMTVQMIWEDISEGRALPQWMAVK